MFKNKFTTYTILFLIVAVHLLLDVVYNSRSILWLLLSILIYILIVIRGVFDIRRDFFFKSIHKTMGFRLKYENGEIKYIPQKQIALTFDDGPHPVLTPKFLDFLHKEKIQATFFVVGKNAEKHPEILERIIKEGHSIGLHSWNHQNYGPFQKTQDQIEEYQNLQEFLKEKIHYKTKLARPPFGVTNPRIMKAFESLELQSIGWSIRSLDTKSNAEQISKRVIKNLKKPNQIILLHDTQEQSLEALESIVRYVKEKNWEFSNLEYFNS